MNLFATSRNTLSLFTLLAAGTLSFSSAFAEGTREQISVSDEAGLRAALSEKYQPDGTTEEKDKIYHDNADIILSGAIFVDTTRTQTEEIKDTDGSVTGTQNITYADNTIFVSATGCKLSGAGFTISSSEISSDVKGSGDLFFLSGTSLSVENIKFAGTLDETKKTGRVFITGNSLFSTLNIGAGTLLENRRLVADEFTNYRAQGGALVSAHIMDEIKLESVKLESATSGNVVFRGNVALGSAENFAGGGAISASGLLAVSGSGETVFENNSAVSEKETAAGGAIFIVNANLNKDGSLSSSSVYPDSVTDETGKKKFGLQVAATTLNFSGNFATGANAQGGAVAVSGGYFDATNASITFSGNQARSTVSGGKAFGGALQLGENAKAKFDAGTTLLFENNALALGAEQSVAGGGAIVLSGASLSLAGKTDFKGNKISSDFGGSALLGGAFYITGTQETVTKPDGTKEKVHTAQATLAGTLSFTGNCVSAKGLSAEKTTGTASNPKTEIVESSAQGGALALVGGNVISGENLTSIAFSENSVSGKTFAQGGALASLSDKTELALAASSEIKFEQNSAKILALGSGEAQTAGIVPAAQGGAIYVAAGTLDLASAGTLKFSENTANASGQENGLAQGGAIFQSAGKLTLGAANFSGNKVFARIAQGGAIYSAGGEQNFAKTTFAQNQALAGTDASAPGTTFARGGTIFAETSAVLNFSGTTEFSTSAALAKSASGVGANGLRSGAAGGAIYSAGTLIFENVSFGNGSATVAGDTNGAAVSGDTNGAAFGGAVYIAGGIFSARTFYANNISAAALGDAHGGAIYVESAGIFDVSGDFTASGNESSGVADAAPKNASGGAVYSTGTLRIGGIFSASGNSAAGRDLASGGAISVAGGTFSVNGNFDHEITNNSVTASGADGVARGGAISVVGGTFRQTAGTLKLSGNKASASGANGKTFGGAIYLAGGNVELTNATIENNTATRGGAVFVDAGTKTASTLKISGNSRISGNTNNDGIYVGVATGTEAKSVVSVIFDTKAKLTQNEDGSVSRTDIETATITDKITVDDGAELVLTKTGAGDLTLGEISASGNAEKISMNFESGKTTLGGEVASLEKLFVASGAEVSLQKELAGYKTAEIAGQFKVEGADAVWNFNAASEITLAGTLAFDGAKAKISGAAKISGTGTFSVKNGTTFNFADASASLTAAQLSVGAGTLILDGAGTLNVTEKLIFTEAGSSEIALANDATLGIVDVARTAKGDVSAKISGTGKLVLYSDASATEPPTKISFSEFFEKIKDETTGEETTTVYGGSFEIADSVKVDAGISVSEGVTLNLAPGSQIEGKKNILLRGGTFLTERGKTLKLETFTVSGNVKSVLGSAGENQSFKMCEVTESTTDENGNPITKTETKSLTLSGELEITESTTFVGSADFAGNTGALAGAGTLRGDVAGTGTVALAKIEGNVNIANGTTMTMSGTTAVSGDINLHYGAALPATRAAGTTANATLKLAAGAKVSSSNIYNYGRILADNETELSGNIVNAGTLIVNKDSTLKIADGSSFTNGNPAESLAGTIDLTAFNSAIDFSAVADETKIKLNNGVVRIDATKLVAKDALPVLGIDDETIFENLKIEDIGSYSLSDRFVWDAAAKELIFLGLNGENLHGTLYGDLQRESLNATYDFMRQTLVRGASRTLTPELYGAYKLQSPYMRGYIEKVRQRGGEVSAKLEAKRKEELAMAEKLNARTVNFWAQGNAFFGEQRERKGFEAYDSERIGALVGASVPFEKWELGFAVVGSEENYDMRADTRHEVEASAYGLSGYALYKNDWFDWTAGTAGMFFSADSTRGEYSGDFDGWRLGVMTEFGVTLRAQSWLALRAFAGLSAAYSHVGSFSESGGGGSLSVDSDGVAGVRGNVGLSSAFLLSDTLQLKLRAAWLADFGNDTCSLDAYMPGTRTEYVIDSRKNETSALEAGASLNWAFSECTEVFVDYTGTVRAGERDNAVSVGLNYFF
ncbi:MAG: autotransporter domain-containing protein [Opitutales bacterium]|nr:autotransporter domain-containing protein [Opitutales bacterium]